MIAQHSSESNEWYTPAWIVERARMTMGTIDLDPASCAQAQLTVQAGMWYGIEDDGLAMRWASNVFLNPPYGRSGLKAKFVHRMLDDYYAQRIKQCVLVVTARMRRV